MTPHGRVRLSVIPQVVTLPSRTVRLSCGISQCRLDTHIPFSFPPKDSSVKQGAVRPLCPLGPRDARLPSARPGGQAGKAGDSRPASAPRFSRGAGEAGEGRPCSTQGKSPAKGTQLGETSRVGDGCASEANVTRRGCSLC